MGQTKSCCCQKPERLKGKPEACSPKQVKQCHGTEQEHPCAPGTTKP